MKIIKKYYRLIASVLVITFMVPVIFAGINTEASTLKSSLSSNMDRYGFDANIDNLTIRLTKPTNRYMNAGDANNRDNVISKYPQGTYYIYKSVNGSINISNEKGVPGSWINVRDLDKRSTKQASSVSTSTNGKKIVLKNSTKVYANAEDALKGRNAVTTYSKGSYYIYKKYKGAINITANSGRAGGWIKANVADETGTSKVSKPKTSTNTSTKNNKVKNAGSRNNNKVRLNKSIPVYMNAANALNGSNQIGTFSSGTYYVYKTYGKAINISKNSSQPGAWIDSRVLNEKTTKPNTNSNKSPKKTTDKKVVNKRHDLQAKGNKVVLPTSTKVFFNAENAIKGINPTGTWSAGSYYIYKVYGNAINISKNPNEAGGWVYATLERLDDTTVEKIKENTSSSNKSTESNSDQFVLVLDPGHGGGIKHNRGGLLFNEGDQNFEFTKKIIEESKKYKNVVAKTTRVKNTDNPDFEERAKAGAGADLFVSIHSNASSPNVRGVEAWGSNSNGYKGDGLAKDITKKWSQTMDTPNRGVKYDQKSGNYVRKAVKGAEDTWKVFKKNEAKEKILLESAFHTNLKDSKAYINNQDVLAKNFMGLVAKHFGLVLK